MLRCADFSPSLLVMRRSCSSAIDCVRGGAIFYPAASFTAYVHNVQGCGFASFRSCPSTRETLALTRRT
jgi:hypothetical protein